MNAANRLGWPLVPLWVLAAVYHRPDHEEGAHAQPRPGAGHVAGRVG